MRALSLLALALLGSCTAWNRSDGQAHYSTPLTFAVPDPAPPLANLDPDHPGRGAIESSPAESAGPPQAPASQPRRAPAVHRTNARGVALTLLAFDDRDLAFRVADKAGGPDTEWQSARDAARAHRAVAAINAGFFTPEGAPLGLVIENGSRFGSWNRASSLTSGVLAVRNGRPQLLRRERWSPGSPAEHLVQAGPLLLEDGRPVGGLSNDSARPRSFLAWDGRHHWIAGAASSATLAGLADALAAQPLSGSRFTIALNLDGGRSSDLWIAPAIDGGPVSTRKLWNKPVRNYLLLTARPNP